MATLTITPELNYAGDIGFAYTVTQTRPGKAPIQPQVQVEAITTRPCPLGGTLVGCEHCGRCAVYGKVNATDRGRRGPFTQGTGPAHGSATVNGDGNFDLHAQTRLQRQRFVHSDRVGRQRRLDEVTIRADVGRCA